MHQLKKDFFILILISFIAFIIQFNFLNQSLFFIDYSNDIFGNYYFGHQLLNKAYEYNFLTGILSTDVNHFYYSQFWFIYANLIKIITSNEISYYITSVYIIFLLNIYSLYFLLNSIDRKNKSKLLVVVIFILFENFINRVAMGHISVSCYFHIFIYINFFYKTFFYDYSNKSLFGFFNSIILVSLVNEYSLIFLFLFSIVFIFLKISFDYNFRKSLNKKEILKFFSYLLISFIIVLFFHQYLFLEKINNINSLLINNSPEKLDLYSVKNPFEYLARFDYERILSFINFMEVDKELINNYFKYQAHIEKYGLNTKEFTFFIGVFLFSIVLFNTIFLETQIKILNFSLLIFSFFSVHSFFPISLIGILNFIAPEIRSVTRMYSIIDVIVLMNLFLFLNFINNKIIKFVIILFIFYELTHNLFYEFKKIKKFDFNKMNDYKNQTFLFIEDNPEEKQLIDFLNLKNLNTDYMILDEVNLKKDHFLFFRQDINEVINKLGKKDFECDKNDICSTEIIDK